LVLQDYFKQSLVISERTFDEETLNALVGKTQSKNAILAKPRIVSSLKTTYFTNKPFSNLSDLFSLRLDCSFLSSAQGGVTSSDETLFRVKAFMISFSP